jgi:hypothetical protein
MWQRILEGGLRDIIRLAKVLCMLESGSILFSNSIKEARHFHVGLSPNIEQCKKNINSFQKLVHK